MRQLEFLFNAFLISSISCIYFTVLKDNLLSRWFLWGYEHLGKYTDTWKWFLYMPIWGCELCFSGQFALWSYLVLFNTYNPFMHIGFISVSILFTKLIYATTESHKA